MRELRCLVHDESPGVWRTRTDQLLNPLAAHITCAWQRSNRNKYKFNANLDDGVCGHALYVLHIVLSYARGRTSASLLALSFSFAGPLDRSIVLRAAVPTAFRRTSTKRIATFSRVRRPAAGSRCAMAHSTSSPIGYGLCAPGLFFHDNTGPLHSSPQSLEELQAERDRAARQRVMKVCVLLPTVIHSPSLWPLRVSRRCLAASALTKLPRTTTLWRS